ncbi:MAG: LysR family transcriptional regulator [Gammaproteobacteria bacterium]
MDLRHLRHFVVVAEELHFGRAAARLGIEQSPLSRSIRDLEAHLGTCLLKRSARGSQLTPPGAALLPEARAILAQVARLKTRTAAIEVQRMHCLRIGVCDAVATLRLTVCVSALRKQYPDLLVEIVPLGPTEAIAAVETGAVDVSVALDPVASPTLARVHCWTERFVTALTDEWKFFPRAQIPVAGILAVDEVLVAEAWAPAAERWLHELAVANAGNMPPVRSVPSCLGLVASIAMGLSIGLLPSGFEDALGCTGVATRSVAGRNPRLPVVLLYREGNQLPGIEALRTVISERPWRFGITTSVAVRAEIPGRSP